MSALLSALAPPEAVMALAPSVVRIMLAAVVEVVTEERRKQA